MENHVVRAVMKSCLICQEICEKASTLQGQKVAQT